MVALEQNRDSLNPSWTLKEALTGGRGDNVSVGGETRHVVSYMRDFLFSPQQARTPLTALSGGERGRLMLARALAKPSNLLVLDEPTNDLDLEMLDVLEEMLGSYTGTVILISHDRDFLDRVVNAVIVPEGEGRWQEYAGGYADMLAQRGADLTSSPRGVKTEADRQARPPKSVAEPASPAGPRRKLSFKEKHALESLPGEMAALETKIGKLQQTLAAPGLYQRDRKAFEDATAALGKAQSDLAAAEERWLELEILRESLG
jgi:ATP-binding cassette subfamily F protein uup